MGTAIGLVVYFMVDYLSKRNRKKLLKNYDAEKDLSRIGEQRRGTGEASGRIAATEFITPRPSEPDGQELLPPTDVSNGGEEVGSDEDNGVKNRNSNKLFKLVRRLRRKRR